MRRPRPGCWLSSRWICRTVRTQVDYGKLFHVLSRPSIGQLDRSRGRRTSRQHELFVIERGSVCPQPAEALVWLPSGNRCLSYTGAKPMTETEIPLELERWAVETPRGAALAAPKRTTLTYSGLLNHLKFASAAFCEAGVRARTVAVLALPNGPEFVTAALAISMRSTCAPLDLSLTAEEYRRYLPRIRASALVCEEGANWPVVHAARELGMRVIRVRPSLGASAGVFELAGAEGAGDRGRERQIDAAFVFPTSAPTEVQKLVPRSHASVRVASRQDAAAL
jgi:non-ribosomal peptide synthetase component E (peptide arylation enzyme)